LQFVFFCRTVRPGRLRSAHPGKNSAYGQWHFVHNLFAKLLPIPTRHLAGACAEATGYLVNKMAPRFSSPGNIHATAKKKFPKRCLVAPVSTRGFSLGMAFPGSGQVFFPFPRRQGADVHPGPTPAPEPFKTIPPRVEKVFRRAWGKLFIAGTHSPSNCGGVLHSGPGPLPPAPGYGQPEKFLHFHFRPTVCRAAHSNRVVVAVLPPHSDRATKPQTKKKHSLVPTP